MLIGTVLVFLIAATPLPEVPEQGVDLRAHWARVSRRFWTLFLLHWLLATSVSLWAQVTILHRQLNLLNPVMLVLPALLMLIYFRNRAVQTIGLIVFGALFLWQSGGTTLT